MKSRRIALLALMVGVTAMLLGSAVLVKQRQTEIVNMAMAAAVDTPSLPVLYEAPGFTLTDSTGTPFSARDLEGKPYIVDFMFTTCPGLCPIMSREMKNIYDDLIDGTDIHFVSISVDPETDTPEKLAEYAADMEADTSRWHFLTGDIETIRDLSVKGFKVGSIDTPQDHSANFILVDREGNIRGYYNSLDGGELAKLRADLRQVL